MIGGALAQLLRSQGWEGTGASLQMFLVQAALCGFVPTALASHFFPHQVQCIVGYILVVSYPED